MPHELSHLCWVGSGHVHGRMLIVAAVRYICRDRLGLAGKLIGKRAYLWRGPCGHPQLARNCS